MKKIMTIALSAIMMAVCSTTVQAQDKKCDKQTTQKEQCCQQHKVGKPCGKHQMQGKMQAKKPMPKKLNKGQIIEDNAKRIARELALDDATSEKFIAVYKEYKEEMMALRPQGRPDKKQDFTEAEAEKFNKERLAAADKRKDLQKKYYNRYSEFLTQKQIQRVNELDRSMMKHHGHPGQMGPKGQMHPKGQMRDSKQK